MLKFEDNEITPEPKEIYNLLFKKENENLKKELEQLQKQVQDS